MAKRLGQIDMFTRRVRSAVPPPLERSVHIAIADLLRWGASPGWLWAHYPSGELRTGGTGALLKRMGVQTGWSDFILISPAGQFHALELKRKGRSPSEDQRAFLHAIEMRGGLADWADSYDLAVAVLQSWGAIRETVHP